MPTAELEHTTGRRQQLLTMIVVGGGFSGVETAGALNDMVRAVLPFYSIAQSLGIRVILIHAAERLLQELDADLANFAGEKLQERGVELRMNSRVREVIRKSGSQRCGWSS